MNSDSAENTKDFTITILQERLPYLTSRIAELQKKAAKLELPPSIGFQILREYEVKEEKNDLVGGKYTDIERLADVRVFGEAPVLQGWHLLGRFDYVAIPGQVMRAMVPGEECPPEVADSPSTRCDACGHKRARNDTFLLRHEDGRVVVVGRSCLKDYLGHVSPEHIARMAAILSELTSMGGEEFWGSYVPDCWDLQGVLCIASYAIRIYGWASSQAPNATKSTVLDLLLPKKRAEEEADRQRELGNITAGDVNRAAECLEWLKTVDTLGSDYLSNLHALSEAGLVTWKSMGIAVSALVAYDRVCERETARANQRAADQVSCYVGEVKKRQEWVVTISMIRGWDTAYGYTTLYKMRDADGNVLTWKASRSQDLYVGDKVRLMGTVKAHDEYKDVKQTLLTRCKVVEVLKDEPESEVA